MVAAKLANMDRADSARIKAGATANLQLQNTRADAARMLNFGGSENLIKPDIESLIIDGLTNDK